MNRNVWLLFCCLAAMNAVTAGQTVMSALIGHALAVDKALNTLPMAIQMTATMAASIPAGIVFSRLGRKPGFYLGCAGSLLGSLTFAFAVWRGNFEIYCIGAAFAGFGFGISQHLRFAAAEVANSEARARAVSLVMAGGILAAIIGPEIVKRTNMLLPPMTFLATYLCLIILPVITAILLAFTKLPPATRNRGAPVPFRTIIARRNFLTAVVCSMVGYGTMNLVMASTPLQMLFCGFGVNASADVIRAHSIAMFLPGFITGRLIQRFGVHPIICVGALFTLLCVRHQPEPSSGGRHLHGGARAARGRLELHVRRRHHAARHRTRSARACPRPGHQRLHRVRHRRLHRLRVRRDRSHRRLDGAEPGGGAPDADRGRRW